jgi:hypothetical protein
MVSSSNSAHGAPVPNDELVLPLLSKEADETVASSVYSDSSNDKITPKPTTGQLVTAAVVAVFATAGAVSSVVSFIMYPAIVLYVSGGVCLFNCPIVIYNQRKLMVLTG